MSHSNTQIIGNLGAAPILRTTPQGAKVTTLSVAENRYEGPERPSVTYWWRVDVWGAQAEACAQYLTRGQQVHIVQAQMKRPRLYTDRDGQTRVADLEATAAPGGVVFGGRPTGAAQSQQQPVEVNERDLEPAQTEHEADVAAIDMEMPV